MYILVWMITINFTSLIVMMPYSPAEEKKYAEGNIYTCSSSIGSLRQEVLKRQGIVGRVFRITLYSELPRPTLQARRRLMSDTNGFSAI